MGSETINFSKLSSEDAKRMKEVKNNLRNESVVVDLLLFMDCTASMDSWIYET